MDDFFPFCGLEFGRFVFELVFVSYSKKVGLDDRG